MGAAPYPTAETQLTAGDVLSVTTDGVSEAQDTSGSLFGAERVTRSLFAMARNSDAAGVVSQLNAAVNEFAGGTEPADDLTILVAGWHPPS